jgi:phenol hydroxylase P5 protein
VTTHRVRIEPLGRTIECAAEQTVLDACLRNGIWIPHACSRGTCGTCKADLLSGTTDMGDESQTCITKGELRDGKVLLCSSVPRSDLVIEAQVPADGGIQLYPVRDYTGWVTSIEECAHETRRIHLELDQPLDFVAGQYVTVRVPESNVRRSYSLANPPTDRRRIELHVRREPDGEATDRWLFRTVELGQEVDISGPYGSFLLRTDRPEPAIMIAGGTGLAPIKAMIRHVLERGHPQTLYLFQGARTRADLYDVEFFEHLAQGYPRQFTYVPVLSDEKWAGAQGMVTDVVGAYFGRARGHVGYVCGPRAMVEAATKALIALRVPSKDIYRETFYDQADRLALSEVGASQVFD